MRTRRSTWRSGGIGSLVLLLPLVASVQAFGLNLCIASDGHAVLELAHVKGPCLAEVERHHPELDAPPIEELAHHPCTDLTLSPGDCGPKSPEERLTGSTIAVVVAGSAGTSPRVSPAGAPSSATRAGDGPPARRTVVLLI